ncbi:MAG: FeoA domain-containing protein [Kiritimatiellia bacterium]|jgi:Fe2+ transport system protein FeoA
MGEFPLSLALPGREITLTVIHGGRGLRARLNSMGLNEGMRLNVLQSHGNGPCIVQVGGTRLVLGHGMAQKLFVKEE